ncbi:MAG: GIY-YIG nuclease family protein [bacterium]|nr:GIY-YIG nuclease family protein [bacterium]
MHYTYVLHRKKGEWYIGYTNNLPRRLAEHQKEWPCELIYYEAYQAEKVARERERKLKHYGSAWRALRKRIIL